MLPPFPVSVSLIRLEVLVPEGRMLPPRDHSYGSNELSAELAAGHHGNLIYMNRKRRESLY